LIFSGANRQELFIGKNKAYNASEYLKNISGVVYILSLETINYQNGIRNFMIYFIEKAKLCICSKDKIRKKFHIDITA
jgi:hypothetical protein